MGPTKIMMIRHAEKPGTYNGSNYDGINAAGQSDKESLVTLGWERAGGIANLFFPTNKNFQNAALAVPDFIYASDPADKEKESKSGKEKEDEPSQRPYQTISALAAKMKIPSSNLNISFAKKHFSEMVTNVLSLNASVVLVSWQHQLILPAETGADSIMTEFLKQTNTTANLNIPAGPWPSDRYDMVLILERPTGTGPFTSFIQVPQMLLAGDVSTPF